MQKPEFVWQLRILGLLVAILLVALILSLYLGQGSNSQADAQRASVANELVLESALSRSANARSARQLGSPDRPDFRDQRGGSPPRSMANPVHSPEAAQDLQEHPSSGQDDEPEDDDPELSIAGTVLNDLGELLSGVEIEARSLDRPSERVRARTDRLGMFRLDRLRSGDYELAVAATAEHHSLSQRLRAGTSGAELHLQRRLRAQVEGYVRDRSGQPLSQVAVRSLGDTATARTDPAGHYTIELDWKKAGSAPVLSFEHPEFRSQRNRIQRPASNQRVIRLDVSLNRRTGPLQVAGQVNDHRGQPVSAAPVWLSASVPRVFRRTQADAFGRFQFDQVEPGEAYRLGVDARSPHRGIVLGPFQFASANEWVEITLDKDNRASLAGRVITLNGKAVAGMGLWIRGNGTATAAGQRVWSNGNGWFAAGDIAAGELWLESVSMPHLSVHGLALEPGEHREFLVPVDWGQGWLFGRVISSRAQPLAGARVSLHWTQGYGELVSVSRRDTRTDSEGYFSFANLGAEVYGLQVQAVDHQPWQNAAWVGLDELVVVLQPGDGETLQ